MILQLPTHLEQRLVQLAKERGQPQEQVIEDFLEQMLAPEPKQYRRASIGMGNSGIGSLSARVDELLFAKDSDS